MKLQTLQILQIFFECRIMVDRGAHIQASTLFVSRSRSVVDCAVVVRACVQCGVCALCVVCVVYEMCGVWKAVCCVWCWLVCWAVCCVSWWCVRFFLSCTENAPVCTFKTPVSQRTRAFWTYTRESFQRTHGSVSLYLLLVSLSSRVSLSLLLVSLDHSSSRLPLLTKL